MDHRGPRIAILLLLAASAAGLVLLVVQSRELDRARIDVPAAPGDPWTARDQWVQLRGGEPARITPMRRVAGRVAIRRRLLPRTPRGGRHALHRPRPAGFAPAAIVLHASGSGQPGVDVTSLGQLRRFLGRRASRASVHYAIDRRGRIMQLVRDRDTAFHVERPGWNDISIGIMLLNDNSGTEPFPTAQLQAAGRLVRLLGARHDIPTQGLVRPRSIDPRMRSNLPRNFPWRTWVDSVRGRGGATMPDRGSSPA